MSDVSRNIRVYAKCEGLNPTGSFKDRGMTVAMTMAVHENSRAVICASTGNTSASAAAYAARAGVMAFVVIPDGKIALGKLAQAMMHGAKVIQIDGDFDAAMEMVKRIPEEADVTLVNSVNPYRLHGQKTAAFEIIDQLGRAPDYHFLPVGNAGNISAYWMGYGEYADSGLPDTKPRMIGCQAAGAAPFIRRHPIEEPETIATAIRIGNPRSWELAQAAVDESRGCFKSSTDNEILKSQKSLADRSGIFCEPASAVSVAGLQVDMTGGRIPDDSLVVCTLTGHGLKDPNVAIQQSPDPFRLSDRSGELRSFILDAIG
jgi:threonine synthase